MDIGYCVSPIVTGDLVLPRVDCCACTLYCVLYVCVYVVYSVLYVKMMALVGCSVVLVGL